MEKPYVVGVDIGGTHLRIGGVTLEGECFSAEVMPSRALVEGGDAIELIAGILERFIGEAGPGCLCASVGFPATVARDRKHVHSVPNLVDAGGRHVMDGRNVVDPLEAKLHLPVVINKDVNNLLEYDLLAYGLERMETVVACYIGTGFGGAVKVNGQILTGRNGVANEIGHIPFRGSGRVCTCGKAACAECHASGKALERIREECFPQTPIGELFLRYADAPELREFVEDCALPIATEVNIFDPDCVLVGGGVPEMERFPRELLLACIHRHTRKPYPDANLDVRFVSHPPEAGVAGAAIHALETLGRRFDVAAFAAKLCNDPFQRNTLSPARGEHHITN